MFGYDSTMVRSVAKAEKSKKKAAAAPKRTNPDIYRFIDFFVRTGEKITGKKPVITRGKDGKLVSIALAKLPESKLETLAVWFFSRKQNLQPTVGAMLSTSVLTELTQEMNKSTFWKEVSELTDRYYPRKTRMNIWRPFSHQDITSMRETMAASMRRLSAGRQA